MIEVSAPSLLVEEPYTPGLSREHVSSRYGIPLEDVAKLGSAENPFGPSPKAAAAIDEARSRLDTYPDWTAGALRRAIGEKFGFDPANVVCGAGETEIIGLVIRAFSRPGGRILMTEPCFPIYHIFAENEGRTPVYARLGPDFRVDASVFLPAIAEHDPAIVFLTNPHSPTGRLMADADIEAVCEAAGPDRLVVLDEAYIHFTQTPGGIEIARRHDNLILLRTFSKAYGLAGLRIGFGLSRNRALIAPHLEHGQHAGRRRCRRNRRRRACRQNRSPYRGHARLYHGTSCGPQSLPDDPELAFELLHDPHCGS
jgi:histidinol-phosphate aminotransferase